MTPQQLDEIEARAKAATKGPWVCDGSDIWHIGESYESKDDPHDFTGIEIMKALRHSKKAQSNLLFCSHAREDVPALVAEVRRLRELAKDAIESAEDSGQYADEIASLGARLDGDDA